MVNYGLFHDLLRDQLLLYLAHNTNHRKISLTRRSLLTRPLTV